MNKGHRVVGTAADMRKMHTSDFLALTGKAIDSAKSAVDFAYHTIAAAEAAVIAAAEAAVSHLLASRPWIPALARMRRGLIAWQVPVVAGSCQQLSACLLALHWQHNRQAVLSSRHSEGLYCFSCAAVES